MIPAPRLHTIAGQPLLAWRCPRPWLAISSAPHGGGLGQRRWVINASVDIDYDRPDPNRHVEEMADELGLHGAGAGMLTAVDVRNEVTAFDTGVHATVTTGIGQPIWAAEAHRREAAGQPGTINAVCFSPLRMSESALVNAVATVAEAKAQALIEAGVDGTGTCTDAVVVLCPTEGEPQAYGGPRSRVGAALARAVHTAVRSGMRAPEV